MTRAFILVLLPLLAGAACTADSADSADAPAVTVRDSAGIRIVENHVPFEAVLAYAELGPADLDIGVIDGDPTYSFSSVLDVRTLRGGDVVVVEGGAQELRVFDSSGSHVRTIGRRGEGPGEFTRIAPLAGVVGDTIWTWDSRLSRMTRFTTDGDVLGDTRLQIENLLVVELTLLGDGTFLAAAVDFLAANDADDFYVAPEPLYRLDASGRPLDSLRNVGGPDLRVTRSTSSSGRPLVMIVPVPMGRDAFYAAGPARIYTGWNRTYEVIARSLAGEPVTMISAPGLERPIDAAEVDALRARRLANCPGEECERNINGMFDGLRLPDRRPAFSSLEVDALENLWVAEYEPTDDPPTGWHVFSPDGELLGQVAMPEGLVVHEIGADYVLGVVRNELDVPFVRRFPLTRIR